MAFDTAVTEKSQFRMTLELRFQNARATGTLSRANQHTRAARAEHRRGGEGNSPMVLCADVLSLAESLSLRVSFVERK
jgi:hypothetical protein